MLSVSRRIKDASDDAGEEQFYSRNSRNHYSYRRQVTTTINSPASKLLRGMLEKSARTLAMRMGAMG